MSNASSHTATSSSGQTYPPSNSSTIDDADAPAPIDIWPRSESDDSNDDADIGAATTDRGSSKGGSKGSGFFRSLVQKISKTYYKRYGFLPNTQQEQDRNALQHEIFKLLFDGRLHLAPVVRPKTVLDIGTGPGIWALEYAQQNPRSAVLGIDIEPVQPPYLVSNCHFQVRDVNEEWDLNTTFDFVHVRMLGDVTDKERLIQTIYDNLNPGGWAEFTEWIVVLESPNNSLNNTSFYKWNELIRQGLKDLGSSLYYPTQYKPLLLKAGFENVTETKNGAPTNACYPGKKLRKIGNMMTQNWIAILEPLTTPVLMNGLGWSVEDVEKLVASVKREIPDTRYHSYMTLLTVYCQKPRRAGTGSSSTSSLRTAIIPETSPRDSTEQVL